jgi:hypothetical protein
MATRNLVRKSPGSAARTARRAPKPQRASAPPGGNARTPKFTRIKASLALTAPPGFLASAILRFAGRERNRRIYSLRLLVGRYEEDSLTVHYAFDGVDTVRCDIPAGRGKHNFLSATALEPFLHKFLDDEGTLDPDPPTIKH